MKKVAKYMLTVLLLTCLSFPISGQAPQKFNYQAVVRDNSGDIISNQSVGIQLSVHDVSATGTIVFRETHNSSTNQFGIVNLEVGTGTAIIGTFSGINWQTGSKYLKVEMDPTGGNNYIALGTTQLISVPYALHSETVTNNEDADSDTTNELQLLSLTGLNLSISKGNTISLPSYIAGQGIHFSGDTISNTGDLSNINELQSLSITGNNLSISSGNTVALPAAPIYTAGSGINITGYVINNTAPDQTVILTGQGGTSITGTYPNFTVSSTSFPTGTSGNTIRHSGSGWISNSLLTNTGSQIGIGVTVPATGFKLDIFGYSNTGIKSSNYISSSANSSGYLGVYGQNDFDGDINLDLGYYNIGVLGKANDAATIDNYGIYGYSNGKAVYGIHADSSDHIGYLGSMHYGVYGQFSSTIYGSLGSSNYGAFGRNGGNKYGYLGSSLYGAYGQYNSTIHGFLGSSSYGAFGRYSSNRYGYLGSSSYGAYGQYISSRYGYLGSINYGAYGCYDSNKFGYLGSNNYGAYGRYSTDKYGYLGSYLYGAYGQYNPTNYGYFGSLNKGAYGTSTVTSGYGYGGYFINSSSGSSSYGVYASGAYTGSSNLGWTYGLYAYSTSTTQDQKGIYNNVNHSGTQGYTYGIHNNVSTASGNTASFRGLYNYAARAADDASTYGIYSQASNGTNVYGIYSYASSGSSNNYAGYFVGNLAYTGTLSNPSDIRFKENLTPIKGVVEKIKQLKTYSYNYKKDHEAKMMNFDEGVQFGFIAQELEILYPELVSNNVNTYFTKTQIGEKEVEEEHEIPYKGINYIGMIPILTEAIKEQQETIENQQKQIDNQQKQIDELKSLLTQLTQSN